MLSLHGQGLLFKPDRPYISIPYISAFLAILKKGHKQLLNIQYVVTFASHSLISSNSWTDVLLHHKGRDDTAGSMQIT